MKPKRIVPFKITSVDGLGQGVSKIADKITFIPKTTIGDEGEAEIMSEKKGVSFARLTKLSAASKRRVKEDCPHFGICPSCHFQHVSYEDELNFKKESLQRLFRKLSVPEIQLIPAPERFYYRNRIQLHYSIKLKLIGMKDPHTFKITPIPNCIIGTIEIQKELDRLYKNNQWLVEVPAGQPEGHLEIYSLNGELKRNWNRPYAEGGFTQVYEKMNQKLKAILKEEWNNFFKGGLIDLFAGNGNLSKELAYTDRLCIDLYKKDHGKEFLNLDLYEKQALTKVIKTVKDKNLTVHNLILDPPRSGFRDLSVWLDTLKPEKAVYVSCDPNTLARDLSGINGYSIYSGYLLDFFPSTFHFETMVFLKRQ